jgi:integrase
MAWGDGSIYRRKDGRWCGQLSVGGRRRYVYGRTRREAESKLRRLRELARRGSLPEGPDRTVSHLLGEFLRQGEGRWRPRTLHDYRRLAGAIEERLGKVKLLRLEPSRLQALFAELGEALGPKAAYDAYRVLRRALNLAVRWGWLPDSPLERVEPPPYRAGERRVWTAEEARRFLRETRGSPYWPWWVIAITCALRPGEACALRWRDVDWERGVLRVERSAQKVAGRWLEGQPKTRASRRQVPLSQLAREALRRQREQLLAKGMPAVGDALVFPNRQGSYTLPSTVGHALHREARRLGLHPIRPHDLRHLSASIVLQMGAPVTLAARFLGHTTPTTTTSVYAHALTDASLVAQLLDQALGAC